MMRVVRLCTGLLRRDRDVLLVRCAYDGEPVPLWVLPGGRQEDGESITRAVAREFREETGLEVAVDALAYVSESFDRAHGLHVVNFTFRVRELGERLAPSPRDAKVVEARFVPIDAAGDLLAADVVRIPAGAALAGPPHPCYFAFDADRVAVPFFGRTARAAGA